MLAEKNELRPNEHKQENTEKQQNGWKESLKVQIDPLKERTTNIKQTKQQEREIF